ncbi:MAG: DEAD/DEAH box helicase, partial [Rhodocyclaceae bacterium]|nr:DEAD/DEAH box helicase [Rhodocyclaceae bacterium]
MDKTSALKREVEAVLGRLGKMLPGFRVRSSQQAMMTTIVDVLMRARSEGETTALDGSHIGVIEAPTGTGKSLAVALPALLVAKETGRKVVISSATVALQEQLIKKDLPLISKALSSPCTFVLAK